MRDRYHVTDWDKRMEYVKMRIYQLGLHILQMKQKMKALADEYWRVANGGSFCFTPGVPLPLNGGDVLPDDLAAAPGGCCAPRDRAWGRSREEPSSVMENGSVTGLDMSEVTIGGINTSSFGGSGR